MRDQLSGEELEILALSTEEQRSINGGAVQLPTIPGFPGPTVPGPTYPWPPDFPGGGTGPTYPYPPTPDPWLL